MAKGTPRKKAGPRKPSTKKAKASTKSKKVARKRKSAASGTVDPAVASILDGWRPTKRASDIQRWTIDRLDKQAGVLRIEQVSMKPAKAARMAVADLAKARTAEVDQLSWWDTGKARLAFMTPTELRAILGSKPDAALAENMVFWVLLRRQPGSAPEVFHATRAARQLAKKLYQAVTDVHPG